VPKQRDKEPFPDERHGKQEARTNRILDAALELVQRWGYRKTTLDDIAKQAGVTKGTLYQHWKTREALFEALLQREYLSFMLDFRERIANDPRSALLSSLIKHLVFLMDTHPLLKAILQGDTDILGDLSDLIRSPTGLQLIPARLQASQVYLEQLREKGLLRINVSIDTQMKRMTAICMGFFLTDRMMPPDRRFSLDEMAEGLGETIQLVFEPEDTPSPEVVEEATQAFLRLFDQFLDALQQRHQAMDDEVDAE
jgi:AcrR family transcriptional regulator